MTDVETMDLDAVDRSELPMSRTDLDSHVSMVAVDRNKQMPQRGAGVNSNFGSSDLAECEAWYVNDAYITPEAI